MLNPEGRVIMISGANRGIGEEVALCLSALGYRVSLGARQPATIDTEMMQGDVLTHQWDAVSATDSTAWVDATLQQFGRIDGLVLNAGVLLEVGLTEGPDEDLDLLWAVNFKGPLKLVRAALPALQASGQGRVVNISSLAGKRLLSPNGLGYAASKHASMALTHAIRQYGWDSGLRATAICPGLVDTEMVASVQPPADQFKLPPSVIANSVAYALALPNEASVAELLVNSRLELSM